MLGITNYDPMQLLIMLNRKKFKAFIVNKDATVKTVAGFAEQITDNEDRVTVFLVDGVSVLSKIKTKLAKYDVFGDYRVVVIDNYDALLKFANIDLVDVYQEKDPNVVSILRIKPEDFNSKLWATKTGVEEITQPVKEELVGKGKVEEQLDRVLATVESDEERAALKEKIVAYCISKKGRRSLFVAIRKAYVFGLHEQMMNDFMTFVDGEYGTQLSDAMSLINKSESSVDPRDISFLETAKKS